MNNGPTLLELTVYGEPAPAGSKTADPVMRKTEQGWVPVLKDGRPVVRQRHANKNTKPWMDKVSREAAESWAFDSLLNGAVWLDIVCFEPRPRGHYRTGRFSELLRPDAPAYPHITKTGDTDKLRRAVQDALTGIVWTDDKLVVSGSDRKLYGHPGRCEIRLGLMAQQTAADLGLAELAPAMPEQEALPIAA